MNCKTLNSPTNVCIVFPTLFQFSLDHFENHLFQNQKKEWAARNTVSHFTCEIKRFQGFDRLLISNVQGCSFQVALDFMKVNASIYIYRRYTWQPTKVYSEPATSQTKNCWTKCTDITDCWIDIIKLLTHSRYFDSEVTMGIDLPSRKIRGHTTTASAKPAAEKYLHIQISSDVFKCSSLFQL